MIESKINIYMRENDSQLWMAMDGSSCPKMDLLVQQLMIADLENGNRLLPKITINDSLFNELCEPWERRSSCQTSW